MPWVLWVALLTTSGLTPGIVGPALVLEEFSRQPAGLDRVMVEASILLERRGGLRGVEIRLPRVAGPSDDMTLVLDTPQKDVVLLRMKRLEHRDRTPEDVIAVVFAKGGDADADGDGKLLLGTLRGTAAENAVRPAVTARGILEDGRVVSLPVTYQPAIADPLGSVADGGVLLLNPNPSRGRVDMRFRLERRSRVSLAVYDLRGRRVRTVLTAVKDAGEHTLTWDGLDELDRPVPAGMYFVRLGAGTQSFTKQFIRLR